MTYQNIIKTEQEYKDLKKACDISVQILKELKDNVKVGVSPKDLDELAGDLCAKYKVLPSFKNVPGPKMPFPSNLCVMVNDQTVHAIPNSSIPFKSGDIIKVDFGVIFNGLFTDHGVTVGIGELSNRRKSMIATVELSVETAIKYALPGSRTGNISNVLGEIAALSAFSSVENFTGHGIGKYIHFPPNIPFFGRPNSGEVLQEGMILCIENWITDGNSDLKLAKDGWTLSTLDGSYSAMSEHMVIVKKKGPEVLTIMT
jgi:methionyl aminopeptidase